MESEQLNLNLKQCPYCKCSIVDRFDELLKCRNCQSRGDANTGLMYPPVNPEP